MKKIFLLLFLLIGFLGYGQTLQYVNTYGYDFNKLKVRDLMGLPTDTFTVPSNLQTVPFIARKGNVTYFWHTVNLVWEQDAGGSGTAGEGITITGGAVNLGGLIASPATGFTSDRTVNTNRKGMIWVNGTISDLVDPGGASWDFGQETFSPNQFLSADTLTANDVDPPTAAMPWSGIFARREIYLNSGILRTQKVFGHSFWLRWNWLDTMSFRTESGDYNNSFQIVNELAPRGAGRQGARASHGTGQNLSRAYGEYATLSTTYLNNTGSNYVYINGHLGGFNSYLAMGADSIMGGFVYYGTGSVTSASSYIAKSYVLAPSNQSFTPRIDSAYFLFDTTRVERSYHGGNMVIGPSVGSANTWSSSDVLKVLGNLVTTDTVNIGAANSMTDTLGVDILLRRRANGGVETIRADELSSFMGAPSLTKGFMTDALTVAGSTTIIPRYFWYDEFQGSQTNTTGSTFMFELASGTGANASATTNASTISGATGYGYAELTTGTTSTGKAVLSGGYGATNQNQMGKVDNDYYYRCEFKNVIINDLSDGSETYKIFIGFQIDNSVSNAIYFTYTDTENSGVWNCTSHNNVTPQTTSTVTTVAADTEYDLAIELYNQVAKFYLNGTLVATHSTQVPPAASIMYAPSAKILKSLGSLARIIYIDAAGLRITHENDL